MVSLSSCGIQHEKRPRVSIQTQRAELKRRHHALEQEIYEAQVQSACDDLKITELKRRKLLVKVARLPQDISVTPWFRYQVEGSKSYYRLKFFGPGIPI
jgi:hypothetical protein